MAECEITGSWGCRTLNVMSRLTFISDEWLQKLDVYVRESVIFRQYVNAKAEHACHVAVGNVGEAKRSIHHILSLEDQARDMLDAWIDAQRQNYLASQVLEQDALTVDVEFELTDGELYIPDPVEVQTEASDLIGDADPD